MIDTNMGFISSAWVGFWLLFGIALCVLGFTFSPYLIGISAVIIPAHALYFSKRKIQALRIPFLILFFLNSLLFLSAVALMNSEGTTWGNSSAWIGFVLVFPAFNSIFILGKSQEKKIFGWNVFLTGAFSTLACVWLTLDASRKIETASQTQAHIYWAPEAGLQSLAVILSGLLLIIGFMKIPLKRKSLVRSVSA